MYYGMKPTDHLVEIKAGDAFSFSPFASTRYSTIICDNLASILVHTSGANLSLAQLSSARREELRVKLKVPKVFRVHILGTKFFLAMQPSLYALLPGLGVLLALFPVKEGRFPGCCFGSFLTNSASS